ncbi:MAG TPA: hypothetical protein VNA16_07070, partial [Abditibacteriaceae bacterium]|nr:hypothetical protein [Abditibacteriaceae bacterium]
NVLSTIAFSPDGKTLASGDGLDARLWDVKTGKLMRTLTSPNRVFSVVFSPDGKTLASGGPNFDRGLISNALTRTSSPTHRAARKSSGEVRLWDVQTGQLLRTFKSGHWVLRIAYAPDGKTLANTSDDDTVRVCRLQ